MKSHKMFFIFSIVMILFVVGVLVKSRLKNFLSSNMVTVSHDAQFRVAILIPVSHPALEEIRKGFVDTLEKFVACKYDDYNANGNRALMRSQAEDIVSKNYDLVFTIATGPALIMKEVCEQRQSTVPIVAAAVNDPVGLYLVNSMESSGNNLTVVTGADSFEEQINLLQFLKPETKKILLVYNPTSELNHKKAVLEQVCKSKLIHVNALEIFTLNDLSQKTPTVIKDHDVIMVLKDNLVVSGIEGLVNICNRMHITLYASDLNSGDKGAALSYGVYEYDDGVESAHKAVQILKDRKKPSEIPSSVCQDFRIKVNTQTMALQNLEIEAHILRLMKSGEVV